MHFIHTFTICFALFIFIFCACFFLANCFMILIFVYVTFDFSTWLLFFVNHSIMIWCSRSFFENLLLFLCSALFFVFVLLFSDNIRACCFLFDYWFLGKLLYYLQIFVLSLVFSVLLWLLSISWPWLVVHAHFVRVCFCWFLSYRPAMLVVISLFWCLLWLFSLLTSAHVVFNHFLSSGELYFFSFVVPFLCLWTFVTFCCFLLFIFLFFGVVCVVFLVFPSAVHSAAIVFCFFLILLYCHRSWLFLPLALCCFVLQ